MDNVVPYQSSGGRRNNPQIGVGHTVWAGSPPTAIPERVLDGIPGCLGWLALLISVASAVAFPKTLLLVASLLAFYAAVRFLVAGIANVNGLRYIHEWERVDWYTQYQEDADENALSWNDVHHVVIIPNYREPEAILNRTLDHLAQQYQAKDRMTIVLAMEAAEAGSVEKAECLSGHWNSYFANFFFTVHPRGLPGEMQCKSANEAWGARWVKRKLVDELGYNLDHIVITTMDADTIWHKNHFYALTYLFALNRKRYLSFWQAPIRYHTNIWDINPLLRIVNAYSTAFELAYLSARWWFPMPISSYSLSLRLLDASGYWDPDVIADEWHMFIKAYFAREGQVEIERIFLPFSADATTGKTLWDALKNRYQQSLRHAWGSKEVGYIIAKMLEHPEMRVRFAFQILFRVAHDILLAGAGWVILTVGSQLPLVLYPNLLERMWQQGFDTTPSFVLMQVSFFLVSVLGIVFWYQDVKARPPRPHPATALDTVLTVLSFPLLPVLTLIFVAIPVLQAQTRLLIGVPLQFRVTKKL
jgi:hypothetical protein